MGGSRDPHIIVIVLDWQTVRSRMRVKLRPAQVDCLAPNRYNQQLIDGPAQEIAPSLTPPPRECPQLTDTYLTNSRSKRRLAQLELRIEGSGNLAVLASRVEDDVGVEEIHARSVRPLN